MSLYMSRNCTGVFDAFFFFFNDPATTEIYALSLHAALPICPGRSRHGPHRPSALTLFFGARRGQPPRRRPDPTCPPDRKSTRLNSSHANISYAVFCLKKKNTSLTPYSIHCIYRLCLPRHVTH